jgi:hypothetical protein
MESAKRWLLSRLVGGGLIVATLVACSRSEQESAPAPIPASTAATGTTSAPLEVPAAVRTPQSQADMYKAAVFLGSHASTTPLSGLLKAFAPEDKRVRVVDILAEAVPAIAKEVRWADIKDLQNPRFTSFRSLSSPVGPLVYTEATTIDGRTIAVAVVVNGHSAALSTVTGVEYAFSGTGLANAASLVFAMRAKVAEHLKTADVDTAEARDLVISSLEDMGEKAGQQPKAPEPEPPTKPQDKASAEMQAMYAKVGKRLIYRSQEARRLVENFDVPCPLTKDGRYLPLVNVLIARLAQMDGKSAYATTVVDSRNGDVRIVDVISRPPDDRVVEESIALTMNSWGELRSGGISVEAVQNACYGSYGPIWVIDK